jgi:enediyne biosynthesis protein E5
MGPIRSTWDSRYFQVLFQLLFLSYGIIYLHWNADALLFFIYIGGSVALQLGIEFFTRKNYDSWKSALISAMSLCLLLKTNHWYIGLLAVVLTVGSKYIFRIGKKHIFNPSAFGIVATILLTGDAWLSPGQWGSNAVIFFAVITLGTIVITRVQRLDVSLAFLLTFVGLLFARQVIYLDWPMDFFIQSITTGSLLLFSFFMISDPKTSPNHPAARILYGMIMAGAAFYITAFYFVNSAPIWVIVIGAPIVWVLDKIFTSKAFQWGQPNLTFSKISVQQKN